jgi:alpha-tubulin suppressor-like RCC1 family protein
MISCGENHTLALDNHNSLWGWVIKIYYIIYISNNNSLHFLNYNKNNRVVLRMENWVDSKMSI